MSRPKHEVADVIERFGINFSRKYNPNAYQLRVLGALSLCRTSALGGHKYRCGNCHRGHISYNSCRNRHCPKCQNETAEQWLVEQQELLLPTPYFMVTFTLPAEAAPAAESEQDASARPDAGQAEPAPPDSGPASGEPRLAVGYAMSDVILPELCIDLFPPRMFLRHRKRSIGSFLCAPIPLRS